MNVFTIKIDPKEVKLLEVNARFMRHEEYKQLVDNIRKDGQLTSTPFLCKEEDGKWLCLSGNHRVMAAIDAGLKEIVCLATDDKLTNDQKVAIQLSQNAIVGQDDPATLKILYEGIIDTEMKKYSGLDDKTLDLLDKFSSISISESNLEFKTLQMIFLPNELENAKKVIDEALKGAKIADEAWLLKRSEYDDWLDAQELVTSSFGIKNVSTAVDIILKVFMKNITQLQEGYQDNSRNKSFVPIETVLGRRKIPAETAKKISAAIAKLQGSGKISKGEEYKALDILADKFLDVKTDGT
jgi:ParB-like chromosome segregation protein Spo0J